MKNKAGRLAFRTVWFAHLLAESIDSFVTSFRSETGNEECDFYCYLYKTVQEDDEETYIFFFIRDQSQFRTQFRRLDPSRAIKLFWIKCMSSPLPKKQFCSLSNTPSPNIVTNSGSTFSWRKKLLFV